MNGATTDPSANINSPPIINIIIIIGASQSFFLILKNNQSSFRNSMDPPTTQINHQGHHSRLTSFYQTEK